MGNIWDPWLIQHQHLQSPSQQDLPLNFDLNEYMNEVIVNPSTINWKVDNGSFLEINDLVQEVDDEVIQLMA